MRLKCVELLVNSGAPALDLLVMASILYTYVKTGNILRGEQDFLEVDKVISETLNGLNKKK